MKPVNAILTTASRALWLALGMVAAIVVMLHYPAMGEMIDSLPAMFQHMTTVKVAGVEIGFDQKTVDLAPDLGGLQQSQKAEILKVMRQLEPDEFQRLFYVGELSNTCDFDNPTTQMRRYVTIDHQLHDLGLAILGPAPVMPQKLPVIGSPHNCYQLRLTDLGWRVKTVLLSAFARAFNERVAAR